MPSLEGVADSARIERPPSFLMILPSSLALPLWDGHPCWSTCARRTRPFSGRAFREHRINVGIRPILFIVRVLRARRAPGRFLPIPSEDARCASTKDPQLPRLYSCLLQHLSCIRPLRFGYFFRWPFRHNLPASITTLRAEIDNPIRILDHIEIVFDHDHSVVRFDKPIKHVVRHSPVAVPGA